MKGKPQAVIDLCSGKIVVIAGDVQKRKKILSISTERTTGISRGSIIDIEEVSRAIRKAKKKAEEKIKATLKEAIVGITGSYLSGRRTIGLTRISGDNFIVTEKDIENAIEQAKVIPPDKELVYLHPNSFILDGVRGIKAPKGLAGLRLEVDTYMLFGPPTSLRNINMALEKAEIQPKFFVFQPIAACYAVLEEEELEEGIILIDIGKQTTDISIWSEGNLVHTTSLGIGGDDITYDIAVELKISLKEAEFLKKKYRKDRDEGDFGNKKSRIDEKRLSETIEAALEEIFESVNAELSKSGIRDRITKGAILVGGVSYLPGIKEMAEEVLNLPVQLGDLREIEGIDKSRYGRDFASSLGLFFMIPNLLEMDSYISGRKIRNLKDLLKFTFGFLKENV